MKCKTLFLKSKSKSKKWDMIIYNILWRLWVNHESSFLSSIVNIKSSVIGCFPGSKDAWFLKILLNYFHQFLKGINPFLIQFSSLLLYALPVCGLKAILSSKFIQNHLFFFGYLNVDLFISICLKRQYKTRAI